MMSGAATSRPPGQPAPSAVVAMAYHYPTPTALAEISTAISTLDGPARRRMSRFVDEIALLELGEWEELHTITLDLSPLFVPYVGHVIWGENYRRGEFMAALKRDMELNGVDLGGELPDHIEPILRYVATVPEPLADLLAVLADAVRKMASTLRTESKDNPYRHVLAATLDSVKDLTPATPVSIGAER